MRLSGAFLLNCELFALTLLFALPLGLVVSFGSMSRCKPLAGLVKTFVWIIRGTPLMLAFWLRRTDGGGGGGFCHQLCLLFF